MAGKEPHLLRARTTCVDVARFVGAIGIVWFHVQAPGSSIGYAALSTFTFLFVYFSVDYRRGLGARARRLLLPWAGWSVFYGLVRIADGDPFEPWMLLTGPSLHLWFLPFAFVTGAFASHFVRSGHTGHFTVLLVGLISLLLLLVKSEPPWLGTPFDQWIYVLPAVLSGLVVRVIWRWEVIAILILLAPFEVALGVVAAMLALSIPGESTYFSRKLSDISLTIYLVHPFAMAALMRGALLEYGTVPLALATALVSTLTALVLSHAQWLVLSRITFRNSPKSD